MTRSRRYDPAVAPGESDRLPQPTAAIDCYAFGMLAQEVLTGQNQGIYVRIVLVVHSFFLIIIQPFIEISFSC